MKRLHTRPVANFRFRKIKALTITAGDGTIFVFAGEVSAVEDITEGMTATIQGGGVPEGDYVMPDGAVWQFEKGVLTKMVEPALSTAQALLKEIRSFRALIADRRSGSRFGGFKPKNRF